MVATAAGLAIEGKIPFVHTFAVFLTGRAYDQIRQAIAIAKLNVKIVGSSAGLSDFGDGATHQSIEDISLMRSIPNMVVICPSDALQVRAALKKIYLYKGPVYLRLSRNDMEDISDKEEFEIGKVYIRKDGHDITVAATGTMVSEALKAAKILEEKNISVQVLDVPTIKPVNTGEFISLCRRTKAVVTAEEHSIIGGLGSTVAETLRTERIPVEFLGIEDKFGQSCNDPEILLENYGLTYKQLMKKIEAVLIHNKG
jgi:transketolase